MASGTQTGKKETVSAGGRTIQESSRKKDRKRQKRQQKLVIAAVILILLGAAYLIGALYFRNHFLPRLCDASIRYVHAHKIQVSGLSQHPI